MSKLTNCKSLLDLGLRYKYDDDHRIAYFPYISGKIDAQKRIRSIKAFQKKVNSHFSQTGYKLIYGTHDDVPYLRINPKDDISIPKLVKYVCQVLNKPIKIRLEHQSCEYNAPTGRCRLVK